MPNSDSRPVFEGLKVADFSWVGVGPIVAKHLADFGATVVRVESMTRPDPLRLAPPFLDGEPGLDRSAFGAAFNSNKLGLALNLSHPGAREAAHRLIRWADVVTDSMTPGTMAKLGLGWDTVRELNPSAIMYSTCQQGQTGPHRSYGGYGTQAASVAGFYEVTGWPDREPAGVYGAYTDFVSPWLLLVALVAALDERRRTGRGQYLDQAQYEAGVSFLGPALLDYTANGRIAARMGNDDPAACPHGAYPCAGEERWLALAVRDEAEWAGLCATLGRDDWRCDARLASVLERRARKDEIDDGIAAWTRQRPAEEAMRVLQEHGVPAGVVQTCEDLFADPQLTHREHFWFLGHEVIGRHAYQAPAFKLARTPAQPRWAAPALGQHSVEVCRDILGFSEDEIAEFVANGAIA